jgi:TonB family protein
MNDDKNIKGLFNVSGCLTTETMLKFLDEKLPQDESSIVQNHLESCELCADALEGFSTVTDRVSILTTLESINREITEKVSQSSTQKQLAQKKTKNLWVYGSVAASIGLLIGLYFIFNQINTQTSSEMAMMADTTIEHKTIPIENDIPETEKSDQDTVEKSTIIQEKTTDPKVLTIGGISIAEPQKKIDDIAKIAPMEYDDTEKIADAEMPEIRGTDTNVTLHYETMDMEPAGNISALTGGVIIKSEEIVFEDMEGLVVESSEMEEFVPVVSGAVSNNKSSTDKKSRKYAPIDNSRELLTASYMVQSDNADDSTIFTVVEESPEFTGGEKALSKFFRKNLVYPKQALKNQIEGTVYLEFTVGKDGTLSDIVVLRPLLYGCDEEAIRLIKMMPPWEPRKENGVPVRTSMSLPVKFELPK